MDTTTAYQQGLLDILQGRVSLWMVLFAAERPDLARAYAMGAMVGQQLELTEAAES